MLLARTSGTDFEYQNWVADGSFQEHWEPNERWYKHDRSCVVITTSREWKPLFFRRSQMLGFQTSIPIQDERDGVIQFAASVIIGRPIGGKWAGIERPKNSLARCETSCPSVMLFAKFPVPISGSSFAWIVEYQKQLLPLQFWFRDWRQTSLHL